MSLTPQEQAELAKLNAELGPPTPEEQMGLGESALQGFKQFSTGKFADEAAGVGAAAGNMLSNLTSGIDPEFQTSTGEAYTQGRDEDREKANRGFSQNPTSYVAGAVPGVAMSAPLFKGKGYIDSALTGGGVGAAFGSGGSEAKDIKGMLLDALKSSAFGMAGGVAAPLLGSAAGRLEDIVLRGMGRAGEAAPAAAQAGAEGASSAAAAAPGVVQRGADYVERQGGILNAVKRMAAKKFGDDEFADVVAPKPAPAPTPEPPSPFGRIPAPEPAVGTSTAQALQAKLGQPPPTGLTFPEPAPAPSQTFGRPITQPLDDNLAGALERPLPSTAPLAAGSRKLSQRFNLEDERAILHSMPSAERQAYFTQLTELHGQNQGGGVAELAREFYLTPSSTAPAMSTQPAHVRAASMERAHTAKQWLTGTPHKEQNPLMAQAMESQRIGKAPAASHPSEMFKQLQARGGDPVEAQKLVDMARAGGWPDAQIRQWLDEAGLGVGGR